MLTGIRRGGKSVLLEQIRDEINSPNTIFLNFEDLSNQRLCEYNALHEYVCEQIGDSKEQFYLFFLVPYSLLTPQKYSSLGP